MIQPLDHGTNQVTVQVKEELAKHIRHSEPKIISDQNLAILSRQLALHANVGSWQRACYILSTDYKAEILRS